MRLTHTTGRDYKGHPVRVYVFECEKSEKDIPKAAKFQFGLRGGVSEPSDRWTTTDPDNAKKLVQYADEFARTALLKDGVGDLEKARKNAIKREKALLSKKINELVEMPEEERQKQILRYIGFAEKDARENGYISTNCSTKLTELRAFQDPQIKERFEEAEQVARIVKTRKRGLENLKWIGEKIPHFWYGKGASVVTESVHVLRQAGDFLRADELARRLEGLRKRFDESRSVLIEHKKRLPYSLTRGSGYGFEPYIPGNLLRNTPENIGNGQPAWLVVVRAGQKYHADGEKHGVGASRGYSYWCDCRAASPEEQEPGETSWRQMQDWKGNQARASKQWSDLVEEVIRRGAYPPGHQRPNGEVIYKPHSDRLEYFVVNHHEIWVLRESKDDHLCNVLHEGVPAIGRRINFCPEINTRLRTAVTAMLIKAPAILENVDLNEKYSPRVFPNAGI